MEEEKKISGKVVNLNMNKDCQVFPGEIYGGVFAMPGANVTVCPPQPKKKADAPTNNELRIQIKERVLKQLESKIDFETDQLGYDEQGKRMTNDRLRLLLRRCLGMGLIPPTREMKEQIDVLWELLIDRREKCHKEAGEDYYRATLLNLFGYFLQRRLLCGRIAVVAGVLVKNPSEAECKHLERALSNSPAMQTVQTMLDYYIEKLNHGEF